jgi:hypothetical protein
LRCPTCGHVVEVGGFREAEELGAAHVAAVHGELLDLADLRRQGERFEALDAEWQRRLRRGGS